MTKSTTEKRYQYSICITRTSIGSDYPSYRWGYGNLTGTVKPCEDCTIGMAKKVVRGVVLT